MKYRDVELKIMTKILIVYGTRYGATASTSEEIANTLRQGGFEVRVVDAKHEKIEDIAEFDLVIVGSGIATGRWTSQAENFLERFQKELAAKKVALFVSCGYACSVFNQGKSEIISRARDKYLEEKARKYDLQPIALGFFGGVYDFNKGKLLRLRKTLEKAAKETEPAVKETEPDVYDTRNWNEIHAWTKSIFQKVRR
jgi:menaquinone-dependent protoporphyrinogen oxidase